jgi:GNAT superfamily N-acetyltransferase
MVELIRTNVRHITKGAYDALLPVISDWWGGDARQLFHSVYVYHFVHTSLVAEESNRFVGVLLGFVSQADPDLAYIHLVATDPTNRRSGLGRLLYESFFEIARRKRCRKIQALVLPGNTTSLKFHAALGFTPTNEGGILKDGVWIIKDYAGPGNDRVVFTRDI